MDNIDEIKKFLSNRPKVLAAYGYGSGIFKQTGYTDKDKPQLDLILVVDDLKKWHLENMKLNPKDYSLTSKLFFKYASINTLKKATGISYLSNIKENNNIYKYGTIEKSDLIEYLITWKSFYLPGRFQKRLLPIIEDKDIKKANKINRNNVLITSLLILDNDKNKLIDVYTNICGLSYLGDTRMKFAENPRKVLNIVEGSFDSLNDIYMNNDYFKVKNNKIIIDKEKLIKDINKLPKNLLEYIDINNDKYKDKIKDYFINLNKYESKTQTIKGLFTNGLVRSIKYASSKIMKKIKN